MPATLKDVAKLAKVSITTASHALNGKKVNENTRQRVIEAAKMLHYYVNINGRNLITQRTHNLMMLVLNFRGVGDMTEDISYYYQMLKGAMSCAQKYGYSVKFETAFWADIRENEYFEQKVFGRSTDGIIIIPQYKFRCDFLKLLEDESYPFVMVNPWAEVLDMHKVYIDNYTGGKLAAKCAGRHDRILFINGPEEHISATMIEQGFIAGLLERGIRFEEEEIIYSDYTHEGGYYAMKKVLSDNVGHPTFVFCANDYMATGVLTAVHEWGLKIPQDISILGFDGMDVSKCVFPRLSTVNVDVSSTGFEAVSRLISLIEHPQNAGELPPVCITPNLLMRNTTRP